MSMLQCSRNSCDNIMCDHTCNECINELIELGSGANVRTFMDSPKGKPVIVDTESDILKIFKER